MTDAMNCTRPADNPFRTERVDRLAYRPARTSWAALEGRFRACGWRAIVIGDHGTGKTRFLATFADRLESGGTPTLRIRCSRDPLPSAADLRGRVLLADELDSLGALTRRRLLFRARRAEGILAAVHRADQSLPVLHHCTTHVEVVATLIEALTGQPPPTDLSRMLERYQGNVRALFGHLYHAAAAARSVPELESQLGAPALWPEPIAATIIAP